MILWDIFYISNIIGLGRKIRTIKSIVILFQRIFIRNNFQHLSSQRNTVIFIKPAAFVSMVWCINVCTTINPYHASTRVFKPSIFLYKSQQYNSTGADSSLISAVTQTAYKWEGKMKETIFTGLPLGPI